MPGAPSMIWTHLLPPDTRAAGTVDPASDSNAFTEALAALSAATIVTNPALAGGADPTGSSDSAPAFQAACAAGGLVYVPPGTYILNSQVQVTVDGTDLRGLGACTVLKTGPGWSAGAGTTPLIQILARDCTVAMLKWSTCDGWGLGLLNQNAVGAHQVNHQAHIEDCWFSQGCAGGLLIDGQQDTVGIYLRNLHFNRVGGGTAGTLDAIQLLDCTDVDGVTIAPSVDGGATTGHGIRIAGASANIRLADMDCGGFPTPAVNSGQAGVRIETGAHGTPKTIRISNSIFQTWDTDVSIAAGSDIVFTDCDFNSANTNGATVASTGNDVHFRGCRFGVAAGNGTGGATAGASLADLKFTAAPHTSSPDCVFGSAIVALNAANGVQASVSLTARNQDAEFPNARFTGAGSAVANWFTGTGGLPRYVRSPGVSPGLTARQPAIAASTTPVTNDTGFDCTVHIVANTLSAVAVSGTAIAGLPLTVRVPANATITLTYSGAAPTWQWFGD